MKFKSLLGITALSCSLLFVSSGAMATIDCEGLYITGYITEDIVITFPSCTIENATVDGSIIASDASSNVISIQNSKVSGDIVIKNGLIAAVSASEAKNITLGNNEVAIVLSSTTAQNLKVNNNVRAVVKVVQSGGNLYCRNNDELWTDPRNYAEGKQDCVASSD